MLSVGPVVVTLDGSEYGVPGPAEPRGRCVQVHTRVAIPDWAMSGSRESDASRNTALSLYTSREALPLILATRGVTDVLKKRP